MKLSEENISTNLCGLGLGNGFLHVTLKITSNERQINRTKSKLKTFCASKNTIKKVKRQLQELENIFVNFLIRDLHLEYSKSSFSIIVRFCGFK